MSRALSTSPAAPSLSRSESKAEAISRVAMDTIHQEVVRREAKTAQLRAARLAKEASDRQAAARATPVVKRKAAAGR